MKIAFLTFGCQPRNPCRPHPGIQPSEVSTRLPSASRRATHLRWPAPGSSRGRAADPAPRRCWCRPGTATVLPLCDGQWRAGCLYGAWSLEPRESREQVSPCGPPAVPACSPPARDPSHSRKNCVHPFCRAPFKNPAQRQRVLGKEGTKKQVPRRRDSLKF